MANENKFRRLQCEQACKKLIEEAGSGGSSIDIYVVAQDGNFEKSGVSFPCIICFEAEDKIYQATVLTETSGQISDKQTGNTFDYEFSNLVYDSQAKTLKADITINMQS